MLDIVGWSIDEDPSIPNKIRNPNIETRNTCLQAGIQNSNVQITKTLGFSASDLGAFSSILL
jgi:hypothetical protein